MMIHIVGLGGVGFWLTVGLSRSITPDQLTCWDDDTLEGSGGMRLPWAPPTTPKANLLRGFLGMAMGQTVTPTFKLGRFTGTIGCTLTPADLVIDCTDLPLTARKQMWGRTKKTGARMIRVSYDGQGSIVVVSTGLPLFAPEAGGYAAVPSLALSLAAGGLGAEAVRRFIEKPVEQFTFHASLGEVIV